MPLNVMIGRWMYIALIVIVLFPWDILTGYNPVTPASALFVGLMFCSLFWLSVPKFNKKSGKSSPAGFGSRAGVWNECRRVAQVEVARVCCLRLYLW